MKNFLNSLFSQLKTVFDTDKFAKFIAEQSINVLVAGVVLAAFYVLWFVTSHLLRRYMPNKTDRTTTDFVSAVVKYLLLSVAVITALDVIGIKTSAVLASLGVAGLTIGFAAKDAFSNLISGVMIYLDRPFVIGDLVEVDGKYGRVEQITLRSTRVVTVDGKMLAVPNADVINRTVTSYTNFPNLRLDIAVTIAVTENIANVRKILLALVKDGTLYKQDPAPRVVVSALNDYNIEIQLQAWVHDEKRHIEMRFELREQIFVSLTKAGVDMPYETFQLAPVQIKVDSPKESPTQSMS